MKYNSQSNTRLNYEIGESQLEKKTNWVNWINLSNPQPESWNEDNLIKKKSMLNDTRPR